jgi:integrase
MSTTHDTIHAARLLLDRLGLDAEDLQWIPVQAPTFAEYLPQVIAASGPGAQRTYHAYWTRILDAFADRRLDEVTATDIEVLMHQVIDTRIIRRNHHGGNCSGEHLLRAIRCVYTHAVADELIAPHHNPAERVTKPRRPASNRHALNPAEIQEINAVVARSGNDVVLDSLIMRLHLETACRRCGALRLREGDIDQRWCLVCLREKNNSLRWQPASPTLIAALIDHRDHRGIGDPDAPLLRYRDGTPLTTRRYDHLWHRIGAELPWVAAQNVSTHWLRHTTITWVERHYGYGIARAYAGHTDTHGASTTTYITGQPHEVALALSALTGEPHPWAQASDTATAAGGIDTATDHVLAPIEFPGAS